MRARVVPFRVSLTQPPLCARCDTQMVLLRVVRAPGRPVIEKFVCAECSLVDDIRRDSQVNAAVELAKSA
jgi:hypothetical protein